MAFHLADQLSRMEIVNKIPFAARKRIRSDTRSLPVFGNSLVRLTLSFWEPRHETLVLGDRLCLPLCDERVRFGARLAAVARRQLQRDLHRQEAVADQVLRYGEREMVCGDWRRHWLA